MSEKETVLLVMGILIFSIVVIGGTVVLLLTAIQISKQKRWAENEKSRFLSHKKNGLLPVSKIVIDVRASAIHSEPWMFEVKRYEGNNIASEEIKRLYWENLNLLNEKYSSYESAYRELNHQSYNRRIRSEQYASVKMQVHEMRKDIIDRCELCYELMKTDAAEEVKARTTLNKGEEDQPKKAQEAERFIPSEERALLNILESPKADDQMKTEAQNLLEKWRLLHQTSLESPETENMKQDLETISRIIDGKELGRIE